MHAGVLAGLCNPCRGDSRICTSDIPNEVWRVMAIDASGGEVVGGDPGSLGTTGARHFDAPAGGPKALGSHCRRTNAETGARK